MIKNNNNNTDNTDKYIGDIIKLHFKVTEDRNVNIIIVVIY